MAKKVTFNVLTGEEKVEEIDIPPPTPEEVAKAKELLEKLK